MGAGGGPAGLPHHHAGVGQAHRLARRHAEARLETAARLERGSRDGRDFRPDQGRAGASNMSTRVLVFGAVLVAACASRTGGAAPAPATPIAPPASPPPADAPL